jgi:hypothetical protein
MRSIRVVRTATLSICVVGIAGMIVTSALDHNGAAITFGIITAVAILCSMVATAVANDIAKDEGKGAVGTDGVDAPSDALAEIVEDRVQDLVHGGADEQAVRQLVGEAVRLGRTLARTAS